MTYIDYLNGFNRWLEHNYLPLSSQILYFRMLDLFNRTGWADTVSVDNLRMMCMIQSDSRHTLLRARDALINAGFLEYQKGKKGMPGKYKLGKGCKKCTENGTVSGTENGTVSGTENGTHIKTKNKTKENPPKGGKEKGFEAFWAAYPKKVGKQAAMKKFKKVNIPVETLLAAIDRQKRSEQWMRDGGRYIPNPTTWLNQGRWEDEIKTNGVNDDDYWAK